nr:hypothetical protein [Rickettsia bellii]
MEKSNRTVSRRAQRILNT